jgi:predicted phage terminase large subunit-like protein
LWPERSGFDRASIESLGVELGEYARAAQLQQRPAPRGGGLFKTAWFSVVDALPAQRRKVRAWDLASTQAGYHTDPDSTAGVLMSRDKAGFYYVEDLVHFKGSPQEVEQAILNTASLDGVGTSIRLPQDPGQAGKAQASYLTRQLSGYTVQAVPVTGAKETRAQPFASQAEAGNVRMLRADWNHTYLADIVDASSDAFNALTNVRSHAVKTLW